MAAFTIGSRTFRSKAAALKEIQAVLYNQDYLGQPLKGADLELITDLFLRHPHCEEKMVKGVSGFTVMVNGGTPGFKKTNGFHVTHPDGTTSMWSLYVALDGKETESPFARAARLAIAPGQIYVKEETYGDLDAIICEECCVNLVPKDGAHVHHEHPMTFAAILNSWISAFGEADVVPNDGIGYRFADRGVEEQFVGWHDDLAVRNVICTPCNLKIH